jgi:glucose/arabinose dehydrogenase
MASTTTSLFIILLAGTSLAQNACPGAFPEADPAIAAKGFTAYVIARNLTNPRGIVFDKDGNLLVLEKLRGVTALKLKDDGNCTSVVSKTQVVSDGTVSDTVIWSF